MCYGTISNLQSLLNDSAGLAPSMVYLTESIIDFVLLTLLDARLSVIDGGSRNGNHYRYLEIAA
jgi:hypothetical protein